MTVVKLRTDHMLPALVASAEADAWMTAPPVSPQAIFRTACWAYLDAVFSGASAATLQTRADNLWWARERMEGTRL